VVVVVVVVAEEGDVVEGTGTKVTITSHVILTATQILSQPPAGLLLNKIDA
jgi:hypothetical protein